MDYVLKCVCILLCILVSTGASTAGLKHYNDDNLLAAFNRQNLINEMLIEKLNILETKIKDFENTVDHMARENKALTEKLNYLKEENEHKDILIQDLRNQKQHETPNNPRGEVRMHAKSKKGSGGLSGDSARIRKQHQRLQTDTVAFFATTAEHFFYAPHNGSTIIFGNVPTNIGNAYFPHHGNFIAPVHGIYEFSFTITYWSTDKLIYTSLMRNDVEVAQILGQIYDTASQRVILELNQGDDMHIVFWGNTDQPLLGEDYSSFSGYLLNVIE